MNEGTGAGRRAPSALGRAGAAAALAAVALLAAGCGGGSHGAGSGASPGQGRLQQLTAFAQCMRGHGEPGFYLEDRANVPSPSPGSAVLSFMGYLVPGVSPRTAQFAGAMKVCKHLLPGGGQSETTQQQIETQVKFAQCMRAHGFSDYPDPQTQNGREVEKPLPSDIDTASPQFEKAQNTCNADS